MTIFFKTLITIAPASISALFLSVGILLFWTQNWIFGFFLLACCSTILFYLTHILHSKRMKLYMVSSILFIPLGFFVAKKQIHIFEQNEQLLLTKDSNIYAEIIDIEKTPYAKFPCCVTLYVTQIKGNEKEIETCKTVVKCHTFRYGKFTVGDHVLCTFNVIKPSKGAFRYFLIKEGIGAYLFIPSLNLTLRSRPFFSFSRFFYRRRAALFAACKKQCSEKTRLLFELLFLGRKEKEHEVVTEIQQSFRQWGIAHMTARSGMHMTIFVMVCYFLLQFFFIPYALKQFLLALIMVLYAFFSYPSISFIRALLTTLFLLYCHFMQRRTNILHLTFLVYITQLLLNPIALFFLDFQLSFLLTIGIGFFSKRIFLKY